MFLVTTADQRFWKTNEKILFLGEWCRLYEKQAFWSKLDYEVLPYHWSDLNKFNSNFSYLQSLYDKTLAQLTVKLNEIHGVNHTRQYWQIILGAWLFYFIEVLYDRFSSILQVIRSKRPAHTWVPSVDLKTCVPLDFQTFDNWSARDSYNCLLYGWIIRQLKEIPYEIKDNIKEFNLPKNFTTHSKSKWVLIYRKIMEGYSSCVPDCLNGIFIFASHLRPWDLVRLQLSLGQIPYLLGPSFLAHDVPINDSLRQNLTFSVGKNLFETLLEKVIPLQIPKLYIEGYFSMHERALKSFPKTSKVIFTGVGLYAHEAFKFWAAWQKEKGVKLVASQHGGAYGSVRISSNENYEKKTADRFFSWGWKDQCFSNVTPLPSGQLEGIRKSIKPSPKGHILFVDWELTRYSRTMFSAPIGPNFAKFLADRPLFLENLFPETRKLLIIRLFPFDRGWGMSERWKKLDSTIKVYRGRKSMYQQLNSSRLFIGTYNSTTHLETLAANFPTLFFWRPELFELRDSALRDHEEMQEAGIFHDSPESLASKVNEIYQDPLAWWYSPDVQKIREKFCFRYARTSKRWISDWKKELIKIAGD